MTTTVKFLDKYYQHTLTPTLALAYEELTGVADVGGEQGVVDAHVQRHLRGVAQHQLLDVAQGRVAGAAARIGLDHWRNLYTLNYQPITVQGSGAAPTITEPSVSLWTPCNVGQTC